MRIETVQILFFLIIFVIIVFFVVYNSFNKQDIPRKIYNEIPPPVIIPTQWWGYGWRPWWRKYDGIPEVGQK